MISRLLTTLRARARHLWIRVKAGQEPALVKAAVAAVLVLAGAVGLNLEVDLPAIPIPFWDGSIEGAVWSLVALVLGTGAATRAKVSPADPNSPGLLKMIWDRLTGKTVTEAGHLTYSRRRDVEPDFEDAGPIIDHAHGDGDLDVGQPAAVSILGGQVLPHRFCPFCGQAAHPEGEICPAVEAVGAHPATEALEVEDDGTGQALPPIEETAGQEVEAPPAMTPEEAAAEARRQARNG